MQNVKRITPETKKSHGSSFSEHHIKSSRFKTAYIDEGNII